MLQKQHLARLAKVEKGFENLKLSKQTRTVRPNSFKIQLHVDLSPRTCREVNICETSPTCETMPDTSSSKVIYSSQMPPFWM